MRRLDSHPSDKTFHRKSLRRDAQSSSSRLTRLRSHWSRERQVLQVTHAFANRMSSTTCAGLSYHTPTYYLTALPNARCSTCRTATPDENAAKANCSQPKMRTK